MNTAIRTSFARPFSTLAAAFAASLAIITPAAHADRAPAPDRVLFRSPDGGALGFHANQDASASTSAVVRSPNPGPTDRARRATITGSPTTWWHAGLTATIDQPIRRGESLLLSFRARLIRTDAEQQRATILAHVQEATSPWSKDLAIETSVGSKWEQFLYPFTSSRALDAGQASVGFGLAFTNQTVEITDVTLAGYGETPLDRLPRTRIAYGGMQADAAWRRDAWRRIDRERMVPLRVAVADQRGEPIPNAHVHAELIRHDFMFGTAVNARVLLGEGSFDGTPQTRDHMRRYQSFLLEHFNAIVFENAMKWPRWGGRENRDRVDRAMDWADHNGLRVRGHCLLWPSTDKSPGHVNRLTARPAALRSALRSRVEDMTRAYAGRITAWDVANEPRVHHEFMDILSWDEFDHWHHIVHQTDPDTRVYLNDFGLLAGEHHQYTLDLARRMLDSGVPLHGIGIQGHFLPGDYDMQRIVDKLERFARTGLAITITEFDFTTDDDQLHADFTRDMIIAALAQPAVEGFFFWGFHPNAHWQPKAALLREDWTERPVVAAYDAIRDRIDTDERGRTDRAGLFTARGMPGLYRITVRHNGATHTASTHFAAGSPAAPVTVGDHTHAEIDR